MGEIDFIEELGFQDVPQIWLEYLGVNVISVVMKGARGVLVQNLGNEVFKIYFRDILILIWERQGGRKKSFLFQKKQVDCSNSEESYFIAKTIVFRIIINLKIFGNEIKNI